mmetsp:Transcript_105875/g.210448  ORF Transcript_105875/g.210448 Transcript_105875/m.210448 type:complete len:232 (-) Transcript_105875:131-826(-)
MRCSAVCVPRCLCGCGRKHAPPEDAEVMQSQEESDQTELAQWMELLKRTPCIDADVILRNAPERLRAHKGFVLAAVERCGLALSFADTSMLSDHDVVLAAVRQDCNAIACAADACCSDKQVMLAAVRSNGHALRFAPGHLRSDKELVVEAVRQSGHAFQFVEKSLLSDTDFLLTVVQTCGNLLQQASDKIRVNRRRASKTPSVWTATIQGAALRQQATNTDSWTATNCWDI